MKEDEVLPMSIYQNIALVVEYDGSNYCGFQKQVSTPNIQSNLEKALSEFCNQSIITTCAGRTDTKVHALYQVINFTTLAKRELHSYIKGINALLPKDIAIKDAKIVTPEFDARRSAISRTYHYYLNLNPVRSAIMHNKVGFFYQELDLDLINQALKYLEGTHDFSAFRASDCQAKSPIRNMHKCNLTQINNMLRFEFSADGFLYHMIRNIMGALIYLGIHKLNLDEFKQLLLDKDRSKAPPTFMPDGLYLVDVAYPNKNFDYIISPWIFQ